MRLPARSNRSKSAAFQNWFARPKQARFAGSLNYRRIDNWRYRRPNRYTCNCLGWRVLQRRNPSFLYSSRDDKPNNTSGAEDL